MAEELGLFRGDAHAAVLEAGTRAPSGGNQQRWRFIVIKDPETKRWIQERFRITPVPGHRVPGNEAEARTMARNDARAKHLAEHLHEVPVLILCCLQHDGSPSDINRGASIYPTVQNMLLAARGLGLASVLTTRPRRGFEKEIKQTRPHQSPGRRGRDLRREVGPQMGGRNVSPGSQLLAAATAGSRLMGLLMKPIP